MTTTIRPTRQALRVHRSHLATTHRAPLVQRRSRPVPPGLRVPRAPSTSFIPMARDPLADETSPPRRDHQSQHHES